MFRYREFRTACKNGETSNVIEALKKCLDFDDIDNYFKACSYISELINKGEFKLNKDLLNLLYNFNHNIAIPIMLRTAGTRIGIIIKNPDLFPIELLSSINRIYYIPLVILIGQSLENSNFAIKLADEDIAVRVIETELELNAQLESLAAVFKEEKISKLILHANPADLDLLIISRACPENTSTYHRQIPLFSTHTYCEQEDSLGKGSWKRNIALPLFERYSTICVSPGERIPLEAFNFIEAYKLLLLNNDPLICLEGIDEELINKVVFISNPDEYADGLKNTKELLVTKDNLSQSLDLSLKFGVPIRFIENNKPYTYEEVLDKFDLKNKFSNVLANIYQKKNSFRKKLPRLLFFRNDSAAPVIESINKNISAALKHAGCPTLDIDIGAMVKASMTKNWDQLKIIQLQIMDQIDHFSPDAALGYNDTGIFRNGESHLLESKKIPYYGLFFDNPFYFMHNLNCCKDKSLTRILTLDKDFIQALKEDGFTETFYFPIATSMHNNSLKNKSLFSAEHFLFTATIKEKRSAEDVSLELADQKDQDFIKYAFSEILEKGVYNIGAILSNYSHFYSKDYKRFQNEVWFRIENQCSSQLRLQTIEALKDFKVNIYGGGNWNNIKLSENHRFHGRLNYSELHEATRQSYGTICRTPLTIQNGIQQRILDCGAAKGFILTDYRPVLEEHFELDKELFVYRNNEELVEKAAFLQKNPEAAQKSIKLLHKKILEQHTWDIRVQELINLITG